MTDVYTENKDYTIPQDAVLQVYETEADALEGDATKALRMHATTGEITRPLYAVEVGVGGGEYAYYNQNPADMRGFEFFLYRRFWYRVNFNEPVIGFYIDWDDGEDNSFDLANAQEVMFEKEQTFGVVSHIYTKNSKFYPLIQAIDKNGFKSKLYTSGDSGNDYSGLERETLSAGQNNSSIVSLSKSTPTDGKINSIDITTNGTAGVEFSSAPTITIEAPASGTTATATATVADASTNSKSNWLTGITITNAGSGYVETPDIQITGGGYGGIAGRARVNINSQNRMPFLVPHTPPPIARLKVDRKEVFAGIDNKVGGPLYGPMGIKADKECFCHLYVECDSAGKNSSPGVDVEVVYEDRGDNIIRETLNTQTGPVTTRKVRRLLRARLKKVKEDTSGSTNGLLTKDQRIFIRVARKTAVAGTAEVTKVRMSAAPNNASTLDGDAFMYLSSPTTDYFLWANTIYWQLGAGGSNTNGATTITLDSVSASAFHPTNGSITFRDSNANERIVTYTGKNAGANQLTGCVWDTPASGGPAGNLSAGSKVTFNDVSSAPSVGGRTGIAVNIEHDATDAEVATAVVTAVNAKSDFNAAIDTAVHATGGLKITNTASGNVTDATEEPSGSSQDNILHSLTVVSGSGGSDTVAKSAGKDFVIGCVSVGNPLLDRAMSNYSVTLDGSSSIARASNNSINKYYFDEGKQDWKLNRITVDDVKTVGGELDDDHYSTYGWFRGTTDSSLTTSWVFNPYVDFLTGSFTSETGNLKNFVRDGINYKDTHGRFLSSEKHVRLQVSDNRTVYDSNNNDTYSKSNIDMWHQDFYAHSHTYGKSGEMQKIYPKQNLSHKYYGMSETPEYFWDSGYTTGRALLLHYGLRGTSEDDSKLFTKGRSWRDPTNFLAGGTSGSAQSNSFLTQDENWDTGTSIGGGPTQFFLLGRNRKFSSIYIGMQNRLISSAAVPGTNGPEFKIYMWYARERDLSDSSSARSLVKEWVPLNFVDNTNAEQDNTSLYRSGSLSWDLPRDWAKATGTSDDWMKYYYDAENMPGLPSAKDGDSHTNWNYTDGNFPPRLGGEGIWSSVLTDWDLETIRNNFRRHAYESDFSTGTDGWSANGGTLSGGASIGGHSDCLKFYCDNSDNHSIDSGSAMNALTGSANLLGTGKGGYFIVTGYYYVPAGNTNLDLAFIAESNNQHLSEAGGGIEDLQTINGTSYNTSLLNTLGTNAWKPFATPVLRPQSSGDLEIHFGDNSISGESQPLGNAERLTFTGANSASDDLIYFRDIKVTHIEDPAAVWRTPLYPIMIGIEAEDHGSTLATKFQINHIETCDNEYSELVTVNDPHHISLNSHSIIDGVQWNRRGNFVNMSDKFGHSEIKRLGASGGQITLNGIADYTSTRKDFNTYMKKDIPVFYDVERKNDEYIRFYGRIVSLGENYPAGNSISKFNAQLEITHVVEFDSDGDWLHDNYISVGGLENTDGFE